MTSKLITGKFLQVEKQRVERIIASLDGLQKATTPDFFYTRLVGRMQNKMEPERKAFFQLRPVFVTAALSIVLIVNIVSLTRLNKQSVQTNKGAGIESFAEAYAMNTATVYE